MKCIGSSTMPRIEQRDRELGNDQEEPPMSSGEPPIVACPRTGLIHRDASLRIEEEAQGREGAGASCDEGGL